MTVLNSNSIQFTVRIADVGAHHFAVQCDIPQQIASADVNGLIFSLPTWIPGSYLIRDFAKNILLLTAQNDLGQTLEIKQLDKTTWQLPSVASAIRLHYTVYAFDLSVRTAWLSTERGFFNGTSLFVRIHGHEQVQHSMQLVAPDDERLSKWRVATSMPRCIDAAADNATFERYGYGQFACNDYYEFIDHPVELGDFASHEFQVAGVKHILVVAGEQRGDLSRLVEDVRVICEAHVARFGVIPMREYWFLLAVVGQGYGGLEHLDSTALLASRDDLPLPNIQSIGKRYRNLLGLFSHEYFHSWNVKRIQPEAFAVQHTGNTTAEAYTEQLWAFEGITSYYDDLTLHTSGVIDANAYLDCLSETASRVYKFSGHTQQTLADSSFNTWTKFYQQDENSPNSIVSYYTKGALVALLMDLQLRRDTALTLDDVMRELWRRYGEPRVPVPEGAIEALLSELSGQDWSGFFAQALRSTDALPLEEMLADFGVQWSLPDQSLASLGLAATNKNGQLTVSQTYAGGAAQAAGISVGDELVAIDSIRLRVNDWQQQIASYTVGSQVEMHVFRHDALQSVRVTLKNATPDKVKLTLMPGVSNAVAERRADWLQLPYSS